MSFSAFETSAQSGQPIELYEIMLGGTPYRYTSAQDTITLGGAEYVPDVMLRGKVQAGREDRREILEIETRTANPFVQLYVGVIPGQQPTISVQRVHRGDFPLPEAITIFDGFVQSVAFIKDCTAAKIACTPRLHASTKRVPRFAFSGMCNHILYDTQCKVDPDNPAFKLSDAEILAVDGSTITVAGVSAFASDGFFDGGFVQVGTQDFRMILNHTGDDLQLLIPFNFNAVGTLIDVRAGCPHTIAACKSKFDNVINFGGFAFVPGKNPFQTGLDY